MFSLVIDYLPFEQELDVVYATTGAGVADICKVLDGEELLQYQQLVREIPVAEAIIQYAVSLVSVSRPGRDAGGTATTPDFIRDYVSWGASIRGSHYLVLAAKARAVLAGRPHVSVQDIQAVAVPVLRNRIVTNFHANSEGIGSEEIIRRLIASVPPPRSGL